MSRAGSILTLLERDTKSASGPDDFAKQVHRKSGGDSDEVLNAMSHSALKHKSVRKYLNSKSGSDDDFDKEVSSHAGKSPHEIHQALKQAAHGGPQ